MEALKERQWFESLVTAWLFVFAAALFSAVNIADPDLFGHLTFGKIALANCRLPSRDIFSYTASGLSWINHEWLAEVVFWAVYSVFSEIGLILFKVCLGTIYCAFLLKIIKTSNLTVTVFVFLFILFISVSFWMFRPQIFTFVFFAALVWLLKEEKLIHIPVIFILWPNFHGGFVAGIALLLLYVMFSKNVRKTALILILSVFATLINPYGIKLHFAILRAFFNPYTRLIIEDWQPFLLFYANPIISITVFLIIFYLVWKKFKLSFDWTVSFVFMILTVTSVRHLPLFAIAAAAPLARIMSDKFDKLNTKIATTTIVAVATLTAFSYSSNFTIKVDQNKFPVYAVDFIKSRNLKGNLFCEFNWGQYLIMRLHPGMKVSIDGRYDTVYPIPFIKEQFDLTQFGIGELPKDSDYAILYADSPLAARLSESQDFLILYKDTVAVIFEKRKKND
ncbi:MAG: hypothetical protein BWY26_00545 [Elusimicrobia bacterium ADurb.Bin231]|nr:MAG: hypothetical protein BWY26_00545 [Elusimicrobia bacterium ADurb.Bin231]